MPTYDRGFRLGLLPEKKWDWRTFATSYGLLICFIIAFILFGLLAPDELTTGLNFHVTELIPMPSLRPEPPPPPLLTAVAPPPAPPPPIRATLSAVIPVGIVKVPLVINV